MIAPPPLQKRHLDIAWTCGLPGCKHATREGSEFHCMLLNWGMPQIVINPIQPGDIGTSPLRMLLRDDLK